MAFNLPTAQYLMTQSASVNAGTFDTTFTNFNNKGAGNLPITTGGASVQNDITEGESSGIYFGYTAQDSTTSIDLTSGAKVLLSSFQFNAPNRINVDTRANRGLVMRIKSGTGASNYKEYNIGGNDTIASSIDGPNTMCIDLGSIGFDTVSGTFDSTDVTSWGWGNTRLNIAGTSSPYAFFQRVFLFDTVKNGTNLPTFTGASSNFSEAVTAVNGTDYTNKIGTWVKQAGNSIFMPCPFSLGDGTTATVFNDNGAAIISPADKATRQENFRLTTDAMRIYLNMRNDVSDSVTLSGSYSWGTAAPWDFDVSNSSACNLSGTFSGMGDFTMGTSVIATGTFTLASGSAVRSKGATLNGITVNGDLAFIGTSLSIDNITVTGTLDIDTAGTYFIDNSTIDTVTNSSGGAVTIESTNSTITTNTGPNITINDVRQASITSVVSGSRLQIFNVTTNAEIVNQVLNSDKYSQAYAEGVGYSSGDVIRIRLTNTDTTTAKLSFVSNVVASSTGWSLLAAQVDDTVYNSIGINGSTVTKFTADYLDSRVDLAIGSNFTIAEFYAWWAYNLTTTAGITTFFGALTAEDTVNFKINNEVLDIFFDNTTSVSVRQTDNRRIYRKDGVYPVVSPTTNGYGLDVVWRNTIFLAETNTTGLTPAESAKLTAIDSNSGLIPALL
jgi:hypothetical protein